MSEWAVITGAGTGIGAALAKHLARKNYKVLAIGRRLEKLLQTQTANPERIYPLCLDIADEKAPSLIDETIPKEEKIKYLVQNAAVGEPAKLAEMQRKEFEYAFNVNVTAPLFLTQKLLPRLQISQGRVLHLGTGVAFTPQLGTISYVLTKNSFFRLYEHLKVELEGTGVHVGSVRPGVVDTEGLWEHIKLASSQKLPHVEYFDKVQKEGAMINSDDVARFIGYLLMDTENEEFQAEEWTIHDQKHWSHWK